MCMCFAPVEEEEKGGCQRGSIVDARKQRKQSKQNITAPGRPIETTEMSTRCVGEAEKLIMSYWLHGVYQRNVKKAN